MTPDPERFAPDAIASSAADARAYFPRGLEQPPGLRFSADALLLASFIGQSAGNAATLLDLGTGCGVVGLAALLARPALAVTGLDLQAECIATARANAARLGLNDRFTPLQADLRDPRPVAQPESFDLASANPPYREPGSGRSPAGMSRALARFETAATLADFARAAAYALKNRGRFYCIFLAERLSVLLQALAQARLEPKRIVPVHGRAADPARLVLVEALKNGGAGLSLDPPLVLYEGTGEGTRLTRQAREFCPFLACNAKDRSPGTT